MIVGSTGPICFCVCRVRVSLTLQWWVRRWPSVRSFFSQWANPRPEDHPARGVAPVSAPMPNHIVPHGRSDYQSGHNVLCFPLYLPRALDVGHRESKRRECQIALYRRRIARWPAPTTERRRRLARLSRLSGYDLWRRITGVIPKPFDPRLSGVVSTAAGACPAMKPAFAPARLTTWSLYKGRGLERVGVQIRAG